MSKTLYVHVIYSGPTDLGRTYANHYLTDNLLVDGIYSGFIPKYELGWVDVYSGGHFSYTEWYLWTASVDTVSFTKPADYNTTPEVVFGPGGDTSSLGSAAHLYHWETVTVPDTYVIPPSPDLAGMASTFAFGDASKSWVTSNNYAVSMTLSGVSVTPGPLLATAIQDAKSSFWAMVDGYAAKLGINGLSTAIHNVSAAANLLNNVMTNGTNLLAVGMSGVSNTQGFDFGTDASSFESAVDTLLTGSALQGLAALDGMVLAPGNPALDAQLHKALEAGQLVAQIASGGTASAPIANMQFELTLGGLVSVTANANLNLVVSGLTGGAVTGMGRRNILVGQNGSDTISDGAGANYINGGGGDNVVVLGSQSSHLPTFEYVNGGTGGHNTLDLTNMGGPVSLSLVSGQAILVPGAALSNPAIAGWNASIKNFSTILGTGQADQITLGTQSVTISAGNGDDSVTVGATPTATIDGGAGRDTVTMPLFATQYTYSGSASGWTVTGPLGNGAGNSTVTIKNVETLKFLDRTVDLTKTDATTSTAAQAVLRHTFDENPVLVANGLVTQSAAVTQIVKNAASTSSVATMSYQFFTGTVPSSGGMDFLVSPTGPNSNNLNSAYYQSFNIENRYINFAVNLGKVGAGQAAFHAAYGTLDLFHATQKAYGVIFGITPSDTKVHALLDPLVAPGLTRADYFASYGGDGTNGLGTKAAMVGWLLAEAVIADLGSYAKSNDAFLTDVALHNASYLVDMIGHYNQASFAFNGG